MLATRHNRCVLVTVLTLSMCVGPMPNRLQADPPLVDKLLSPFKRRGKKPKTQHDPAIETLAKNIDWLQHEIDDWGSVTAKTPDVWGEARLTKYRREVEQELSDEVDGFVPTRVSGAQSVADSAFLAAAFALRGNSPLGAGESRVPVPGASVQISNANQSTAEVPADGRPSSTISINPNRPDAVFGTNNFNINQQIELEQVQQLDQLKRYLDHLNELRRINEGDDAADAPGYSLNLVRIPVSILPGTHSQQGYGAEITMTATPVIDSTLLPHVYRDFVINDLVDQLAIPLTRFFNSNRIGLSPSNAYSQEIPTSSGQLAAPPLATFMSLNASTNNSVGATTFSQETTARANRLGIDANQYAELEREIIEFCDTVDLPTASTRRSLLPYPPRHLPDNIGVENLTSIAYAVYLAFHSDIINRQVAHVTDVQAFLREELSSAYSLLQQPQWGDLWNIGQMFEPNLAEAIRLRESQQVEQIRKDFLAQLERNIKDPAACALAWCIYVDAVLLNRQMNDSVAETLGDGVCADGIHYEFFHPQPTPETSEIFAQYVSARWPLRIFTVDPVNTEQNIVDTSSVFRQMQLAVSLAFASGQASASAALQTLRMIQRDIATVDLNRTVVGFSHGNDTFGWRFYPRFQTPPVESNSRVFFRDLLVGGPTDKQLLKSRTIEPGMRECVAIVIMPSFVSDVTIDTHSNWFRLDKPGSTALSNSETVKLSRSIQAMRHNAQACVRNEHLYRDGEVQRLLRRVDQLDRELPLQTLNCQLPVENSLGGFEILSAGTRELAPELLGWYGSPGYNRETGGQFFLAGDNFSIHETRLIAGNSVIPTTNVEMLSRQIISVTLPPGLPVIDDEHLSDVFPGDYAGYVDLHVATPYGVSGHMLLPTLRAEPATTQATQPILTPLVTEFDIEATQNNNVFSVTRIRPRALPLATIELPANSPLASRNVDLVLTPQSADGVLMPINIPSLRATGNNINADGTQVFQLITENNGSVRQSLQDYVLWRLRQSPSSQTIDLTISASLSDSTENHSTPVVGTSTFRLHVNFTPAAGG